jgi:hypothetical protein
VILCLLQGCVVVSILVGVFVYVLGGFKEYRYVFRVPHGQHSI